MNNIEPSSLLKPAFTIAAQTGVGTLCGHIINVVNQYMHPGKVILGVPAALIITPFQACICSLTYAVVDKIALQIFDSTKYEEPIYQTVRMAVVLSLSAGVTSVCLGITFQVAAMTIAASIIGTSLLLGTVNAYNHLVHA